VTLAQAILDEMSQRGVTARVDGEILRLRPREALDDDLLARIREHKPEIIHALAAIPPMPKGIRLVEWKLKEPPVAIEVCSVVVDTDRFARTTLEQLGTALTQPKRWVGWTIPQLIDRLAQVGVRVAFDASAFVERKA